MAEANSRLVPSLNSIRRTRFLGAADMQHSGPAIEQLSVRSLKPYPRNARRHSKDQVKQIAASITRFGFNNPILIADDGEIVAGHGRLAAAKLLGLETVPTLRLSHLTESITSQTALSEFPPATAANCRRSPESKIFGECPGFPAAFRSVAASKMAAISRTPTMPASSTMTSVSASRACR